jgi:tRNA modification GTPase
VGAGTGDEVVALVAGGEPPEVEIHCHGGPAPVAMVVEALVAAGAERRQPVAWVRHDARSLVAAEAFVDLARAPTLRTAEILLEQSQGALEAEVADLVRLVEPSRDRALEGLDRLLARSVFSRKLVEGWTVVLAGRPNVGKSCLLNALAGYDRAIVDPAPGTTRDVVTVRTAFDGWPVELSDTAGLRDAYDPIETAGIALARARQAEADLTLLVLDRSEPLTESDGALRAALSASGGLVVASKADLPAAWEPGDASVLTVSALSGDGLDRLAASVAHRLVPDPPPPGAGVPFRPSHVRRLEAARGALRRGDPGAAIGSLESLLTGLPAD